MDKNARSLVQSVIDHTIQDLLQYVKMNLEQQNVEEVTVSIIKNMCNLKEYQELTEKIREDEVDPMKHYIAGNIIGQLDDCFPNMDVSFPSKADWRGDYKITFDFNKALLANMKVVENIVKSFKDEANIKGVELESKEYSANVNKHLEDVFAIAALLYQYKYKLSFTYANCWIRSASFYVYQINNA